MILAAIAAPLLTPYNPIAQNLNAAFLPPRSPGHPLGTDNFGRDIWSRIVYGTRMDLQIGFMAVLFPFAFGSLIGVITGFLGGKVDMVFMRVVDVLMAFPFLILVIAIMSILGPGLKNLYIAIGVVGWIAVRAAGARRDAGHAQPRIRAGRHDRRLPASGGSSCATSCRTASQPALIYVFTGMVLAIMTGATLSFLGLGLQPPTPEWGAMIAEGRQFLLLAWWMPTLPGIALLIVGVALEPDRRRSVGATVKPLQGMLTMSPTPGMKETGWLEFKYRNTGEPIRFPVGTLHGGAGDGPTLVVVGGMHGSEFAGIEAAIRIFNEVDPARLRGTLKVCMIYNLPAFVNNLGFVVPHDGKNPSTTFPGSPIGTYGEAMAYYFDQEVLSKADDMVELHGGDIPEALTPFVIAPVTGDEALDARIRAMAVAYNIPIIAARKMPDPARPRCARRSA